MPVPARYIFQIAAAYVKTAADNAEILTDSTANLKWNIGYLTFKDNIRTYLRLAQNGRCAFCRCRVSRGTSWSNLEHLVPKGDYPQFSFLPENLVYCCTRCNMSKVAGNTIANPIPDKSRQIFPANSAGFQIVNPYYDPYHFHIDFIDQIIIVAANNSPKGEETIRIYKLARPELAEDRASEFQLDQKTLNQQLLARLTRSDIDQTTKDQINAVIANIPTWTL